MSPMHRLLLLPLCAAALWAGCALAQGAVPGEYEVKAVFIYNFSKFIDWPATGSDQMRLCVLGADPFDGALATVEGRPVGGRRFATRHVEALAEVSAQSCDILFIARSEAEHLPNVLAELNHAPILTIGDTEGQAEEGAMISFYLDDDKVRFEVNPRAAAQAGLKPSAKLLQLGRIVTSAQ